MSGTAMAYSEDDAPMKIPMAVFVGVLEGGGCGYAEESKSESSALRIPASVSELPILFLH